ncbi:MAG: sulfatase-like hydrolase/transferase [Acidobacteriota bacterium]|jgi:hypothetical protein
MLARRSLLVSPLATSNPRPNVLLILSDDQGHGDSSRQKNPLLSAPHLDRLARQGAIFSRFSVSPVCAPTRTALLTGRYRLRTGFHEVTKGRKTLGAGEITLVDCLSYAGYRTGPGGKWHLGENYPYAPHARGFDGFIGFSPGHWNWYLDSPLARIGKPHPTRGYLAAAPRTIPGFLTSPTTPNAPYQVPDFYFQRFAGRGRSPAELSIYGMASNLDDNLGCLLSAVNGNTIVLFLWNNEPQTDRFNAGLRVRKGSVYKAASAALSSFVIPPAFVPDKSSLHISAQSRKVIRHKVPLAAPAASNFHRRNSDRRTHLDSLLFRSSGRSKNPAFGNSTRIPSSAPSDR